MSNELEEAQKTGSLILQLRKKLRQIDEKYEPKIIKFAENAVYFLPMDEKDKDGYLKKILLDNFDTFPYLSIDMASLLREAEKVMETGLTDAVVRALNYEDISSQTVAQNIELLKELSFMNGYLSEMVETAIRYENKIPQGLFWSQFINHIRNKVKKGQTKAYVISNALISKASEKSPEITDIIISFDPLLGYDTDIGIPEDYSDFKNDLNSTAIEWYKVGYILGRKNFNLHEQTNTAYTGVI